MESPGDHPTDSGASSQISVTDTSVSVRESPGKPQDPHDDSPETLDSQRSAPHLNPAEHTIRDFAFSEREIMTAKQLAILQAVKNMIEKMSAFKEQLHRTRLYLVGQNASGKPIYKWSPYQNWRKLRAALDELYLAEDDMRKERDLCEGVNLSSSQTATYLNRGRALATAIMTIISKNRELLDVHEQHGWEAAINRSLQYNAKQKERLKKRVAGEVKIFKKYMSLGIAAVHSATDLLEELAEVEQSDAEVEHPEAEAEHSGAEDSPVGLPDDVPDQQQETSDPSPQAPQPVIRRRYSVFWKCFCLYAIVLFFMAVVGVVSISATVHDLNTRVTALETLMDKAEELHVSRPSKMVL